ncbi:hypothetical protein [Janthinobacterium sp. CG_S6]|uniref:hypothetical protein n=1 Tax=Janthinobacterium sp. CG_S6 TaxID=3071707 RepID=UPI002DFBB565|nr:hypothetical protein [Janthinobacterium sp. CG_S6]
MQITKEILKEWDDCSAVYAWFIEKFPQGADVRVVGTALRDDKRYDDARWLTSHVFDSFIKAPEQIAAYVDADVAGTLKEVEGSPNSSSGYSSTAASSGDSSTAASSGDYSKAASSGYSSTAASSGYSSKAASSGYSSTAASSGDSSTAASSGDSSTAASSGNYSKAASSGNYSTAASSGDSSTAASSGNYSTAASSGDSSTAEAKGEKTIAMVAGCNGRARAGEKGAFALAWLDGEQMRIAVGVVGENDIKADIWYRVDAGHLVEA